MPWHILGRQSMGDCFDQSQAIKLDGKALSLSNAVLRGSGTFPGQETERVVRRVIVKESWGNS